jgi:ABC-type bacteriocin/lantibiotic exporter with double-glycine peptidase domain
LIKPAKGQILIDNKFLGKEISYSNWQRQIGLVRQKPYLKSGNLLNLILGKQININKKNALKEAKYFAKLACIEEFIESLPFGYMQHINEDGNTLSGGQIQRIAIASTLALKPSILILDESTSGVDKATETSFFENIFKLENLTVIAISHSSNVERLFSKKIIF